jgi:hypothetical protein
MLAQFVKDEPFRVLLPLNEEVVFLNGDGALWLETNFRPETLGNERPGKPVDRKAKIVKFPQMDISAECGMVLFQRSAMDKLFRPLLPPPLAMRQMRHENGIVK